MDEKKYMENRLDHQIQWYDNKSMICQKRFKLIRVLEILFAALIPLLSIFPDERHIVKITIAVLGTTIVVLAGIKGLNKYQELWIAYRTTAETLKHHKYLFEAKAQPYDKKDAFQRLVENVEAIISREHSNWSTMIKEAQKKKA